MNVKKKNKQKRSAGAGIKFWKIASSLIVEFKLAVHHSRATAFIDDHFGQVPFDDVHVGTEINERHAREFGGSATRLQVIGDHLLLLLLFRQQLFLLAPFLIGVAQGQRQLFAHLVDDVRMVTEEGIRCPSSSASAAATAIATAIIGVISARSDDPIVPAECPETDEESLLATGRCRRAAIQRSPSTQPTRTARIRVDDDERPVLSNLLLLFLIVLFSILLDQSPPPLLPLLALLLLLLLLFLGLMVDG